MRLSNERDSVRDRDLAQVPFSDIEKIRIRQALADIAKKAEWLADRPTDISDIRVRDLNDLYDAYMIIQRTVFYNPNKA